MKQDPLPQVFAAFAGWIRHIDSLLEKSDQAFTNAEEALRRGDTKDFGDKIGTAHGTVINARKELANALARGMDLPSDS